MGPIGFAAQRSVDQSLTAFGDVFVQPTLRWNQGVNNYMVYAMTNLPVGAYDRRVSSILGLAIGRSTPAGATPISTRSPANEFSVVSGLTYNFRKPEPGLPERRRLASRLGRLALRDQADAYRAGRLFLSADHRRQRFWRHARRLQIACDRRSGPQIGFLFPVGDMQGYLNLKVYKEVEASTAPRAGMPG